MVTFLSGGTGTPKLLSGADGTFPREETTVIGNTGDDVELGGVVVCPDLDTVLFERGGVLDRQTWWGIADDTHETHDALSRLTEATVLGGEPRYLPADHQTMGRRIANWRRFDAVPEFMTIGDTDRAIHLFRTSLLDRGRTLTEVTATLVDAFDIRISLVPMSNDPVATTLHTRSGPMHFQEFWVARRAEPIVDDVEYRGADGAEPAPPVRDALTEPVVIGPSNPVTSIGPMLSIDGFEAALSKTPVVAVSPFVEDRVFSGPAKTLMKSIGYEPSTAGVAEAYPFVDAFVLDEEDGTDLDRPVFRTDTHMSTPEDATRVCLAVRDALEEVT